MKYAVKRAIPTVSARSASIRTSTVASPRCRHFRATTTATSATRVPRVGNVARNGYAFAAISQSHEGKPRRVVNGGKRVQQLVGYFGAAPINRRYSVSESAVLIATAQLNPVGGNDGTDEDLPSTNELTDNRAISTLSPRPRA